MGELDPAAVGDALGADHRRREVAARSRWNRSLPLPELFTDRWERARTLGFGDGASIYDSALVLGDVEVGPNTWIGPNTLLDGSGGRLTIGAWCSISAGVHIYTHDTVRRSLSLGAAPTVAGPVSVGDGCHLGAQSVVVLGTTIGDRCVIGANSFVNTDVADRSIVVGSPARLVGRVVGDGEDVRLEVGPDAVAALLAGVGWHAMSIVIVDYGMGNVGSIANMLRKLGASSEVSGDPDRIATAESLVLPGVGVFDVAMDTLRATGLVEPLERQVRDRGVPLLGICLGMQLLASSSEEGTSAGLGWIPGRVTRLADAGPDGPVRIPHMGWSTVTATSDSTRLPSLGTGDARYYFVHSYAFRCDDPDDAVGESAYGLPFTSVVERDNVIGVQFHPEKSHRHGMALLRDFAGV